MPYCPACDMEFIDGITACTDCGGPLVASKEVAEAIKKKETDELLARQQAEYEALQASFQDSSEMEELLQEQAMKKPREQTHVYVRKSQQYDDLKSSASAFLLIGVILTAFSVLCWIGMIRLPINLLSKGLLTLLGLAALYIAYTSNRSAKKIEGQIAEEETATRQLISWFLENYTGEELDRQLAEESAELGPEELALKRFELIQDILITSHDIADQSYADLLADELYGMLYKD